MITGLWIGGLIVSSGLWLADWLAKKNFRLPFKKIFSFSLFYFMVIPFLYWFNLIGHPSNLLWGIDKMILGIIVGSIVFLFSIWFDSWLRKINNNHIIFYYQKVIIPIFWLSVVSFIFYLITS